MTEPDWKKLAEARGRELARLTVDAEARGQELKRLRLAADRAPKIVGGAKTLRPVRPNLGLAALYKKKIATLVDEMDASIMYWLRAGYRADPPVMSADEAPAIELRRVVAGLRRQWLKRFNVAASDLARWFSRSVYRRSDRVLAKILRDGGWSVDFKMTPGMRDIFHASVAENVALIKSIPQRYLTDVEGAVMRSVAAGRDLSQLTKELQKYRGVTVRRAALIARDQNNKVSAAFTRARYVELGVEEAVWVHSHAGKKPRPTHLKNDGNRYDVKKGWYDPDPRVRRHVHPGELINCRCFSRPVVPGFS